MPCQLSSWIRCYHCLNTVKDSSTARTWDHYTACIPCRAACDVQYTRKHACPSFAKTFIRLHIPVIVHLIYVQACRLLALHSLPRDLTQVKAVNVFENKMVTCIIVCALFSRFQSLTRCLLYQWQFLFHAFKLFYILQCHLKKKTFLLMYYYWISCLCILHSRGLYKL